MKLTTRRKLLFLLPFALVAAALGVAVRAWRAEPGELPAWVALPAVPASRMPGPSPGSDGGPSPGLPPAPAIEGQVPPSLEGTPYKTYGEGCAWLTRRTGVTYPFTTCLREQLVTDAYELHDGIWGPPVPRAKAAGEVRVGTFGGSSVEGYPTHGRSWPRDLDALLAADPGGPRTYRVLNFGISGASSEPMVWRLRHEAPLVGLDVAILYSGANDVLTCALFDVETQSFVSDYLRTGELQPLEDIHPWFVEHRADWDRAWAARREALEAITLRKGLSLEVLADKAWFEILGIELTRELAREPVPGDPVRPGDVEASFLGELPPEIVARSPLLVNVRAFLEGAQGLGIRPILVIPPLAGTCHGLLTLTCASHPVTAADQVAYLTRAVPPVLREVAAELGVPVVDLAGDLASRDDPCDLFHDSVHLEPPGLRRVAELLAPVVRAVAADDAVASR